MLILSRKKDESIVINSDITITVVEVRGDKIRLGIVAPVAVPVHRLEVFNDLHPGDPPLVVVLPPPRKKKSRWRK